MLEMSGRRDTSEESYNLEVELDCETGCQCYSDETQGIGMHKAAGAQMMILKSSDAEDRASRLSSCSAGFQFYSDPLFPFKTGMFSALCVGNL